MGSCQNYGPFLGTLDIRGRIIIGTQKGDHNFDYQPYNPLGTPQASRSAGKSLSTRKQSLPEPPKVCKIMAFLAIIRSLGLLFYILLGFRYKPIASPQLHPKLKVQGFWG